MKNGADAKDKRSIALYIRVSTQYQADDGDSLTMQKKRLFDYTSVHYPNENVILYDDPGFSAKNMDRPGFQRMMDDVHAFKIKMIIVWKLDRFSRSIADFSVTIKDLEKYECTFLSLNENFETTSAIGRATLNILLVFAQLEREMTSERVISVMKSRAQDGLWNGSKVPYGFKWVPAEGDLAPGYPEVDEKEAETVKEIFRLYLKTRSTTQITRYLNENNIPTKRGGEWTSKTVADILRRPMYIGTYVYNKRRSSWGKVKPASEWIVKEGLFPAIVDKDIFDEANRIMDENNRMKNRPGSQHQAKVCHVFAGLLKCDACGKNFQSRNTDKIRASGLRPSIYSCAGKYRFKTCQAPGISDIVLGPFTFSLFQNIIKLFSERKKDLDRKGLEIKVLHGDVLSGYMLSDESVDILYDIYTGRAFLAGKKTMLDQKGSVSDIRNASEIKGIEEKIKRLDRAMERLKKLFLFGDEGIDEKEYITEKQSLQREKDKLNAELEKIKADSFNEMNDVHFAEIASDIILEDAFLGDEDIDYTDLYVTIGPERLKEIVNKLLQAIYISRGYPVKVVFKNGLELGFIKKSDDK